ncbi:MAG: indolepyruvate oxidoreductase subunit beta [Alkaliphilus sp.]
MKENKNILLVGVGGQGIILASKILSQGLIAAGFDAKMSEVHGMAQRGGSVTTQVRYGEKVYSPIIGKGKADIIVGFEKMETLRWLEYLKPNGKIVVNDYTIPSTPILIGKAKYPTGILEQFEKIVGSENMTIVKAAEIATNIGNIRAQNIVLLGALIKSVGIESYDWEKIIKTNVKKRFIELNLNAINKGMETVQ